MSAYTVQLGDTFESISRSQFGTADQAANIQAANPGVSNKFFPEGDVVSKLDLILMESNMFVIDTVCQIESISVESLHQ